MEGIEITDEYRLPGKIEEELTSLNDLIRENTQLISLYPDDFALKQNLEILKNRQDVLLSELDEVYRRFKQDAFDISLKGDVVNGANISLYFIGKIMVNLQEIVTSIAQSIREGPTSRGTISKKIREYSRLNLVATGPGSFRIIVTSYQPTLVDSLAKSSLARFNDLIECKDNGDLIKREIKELGIRVVSKYGDFLDAIYKNNANVRFYEKIIPENFRPKEISSDLAKRIYDVIVEEESKTDEEVVYRGILKGLSLISYTFEFLIADSKKTIKGTFDQSIDFDVKDHLDKVTNARFKLHQHYSKITEEIKKEWELLGFEL